MDTPSHYTRGVSPQELEVIKSALTQEEFQGFLEETIIRFRDYYDESTREKLLFYRGHDLG